MVSRPRTPTEKKRLSYERDGRNTYGGNNKAARKAIPAFKASTSRTMRHAVRQALEQMDVNLSAERAETKIAAETFAGRNPIKRKDADTPLGEVIALKKKKAIARVGAKKVRRTRNLAAASGKTAK